ncbi:MAG: ATP synthase F1 subunit epsilon [bacterium]
MAETLHCEILTMGESLYSGAAKFVVATSVDGEVGVLPGHAPLVSALGDGSLRITDPSGKIERFRASGGFLHVFENRVTILTSECVRA